MQVSIFALNLWRHKTYAKHGSQVLRYLDELADFIEFYIKTRYSDEVRKIESNIWHGRASDMKVPVSVYWPYFVPKDYQDIATFDRHILHASFGQDLQIYLGYGLDLKPQGYDASGYCECRVYDLDGKRKPQDMLYADMHAFTGTSLLPGARSIYEYYSNVCRTITHEIDHELNKKAGAPHSVWFGNVHKAKDLPLVTWYRPDVMPRNTLEQVKARYFVSQQDPRTV